MARIRKARIFDVRLATDATPQGEFRRAWPHQIGRQRKHERARALLLSLQDALGLGIERDRQRGHRIDGNVPPRYLEYDS